MRRLLQTAWSQLESCNSNNVAGQSVQNLQDIIVLYLVKYYPGR